MVQLNLLPDVKLHYIEAQRTKRLLTVVSVVVAVISLAVLIIMLLMVDVVQKKSMNDLNRDIATYSTQLKNTKNLNRILTVQNQISTLAQLHAEKPVTSRLFGYISQVTPGQAALSKLTLDFQAQTLTIGGSAPSLDVVSTYTNTLKATTYSTGSGSVSQKAFSNVVLTTFGRDSKGATFTITVNFDPAIFDSKNNVTLIPPSTSQADQSSVFKVEQ